MVLQLMSWPQQVPTLPSRTQLLNLQTENCSPKREKKVEKIPRLPESMRTVTAENTPGAAQTQGSGSPWS